MNIRFILNNSEAIIDANPQTRLSAILRDHFGLLATKESCFNGECGSCTVLLDGEPVPSCVIPVFTVKDRNVLTLEGFEKTENCEIIKKSLKTAGCNLCGFCYQGRILVINHIIEKYSELSDNDIFEALSGNRCECTDFKSLKKGVRLAHLTLKRKKKAGNS